VFAAVFLALWPGAPFDAPPATQACGPFPPQYSFARALAPDAPNYLEGELGVVQPSFVRAYLFVAWRHMSGVPFTDVERQAFGAPRAVEPDAARERGPARWQRARAGILGDTPQESVNQWKRVTGNRYQYVLNCPDAAFDTAADTLASLLEELGAADPRVIEWTGVQDRVFSRCDGDDGSPVAEALPAGAPERARVEREYQLATAAFYGWQWQDAESRFRAIAADPTSRWRHWGDYLAARTVIRRATLEDPDTPFDAPLLRRAGAMLREAAARATVPAVRSAATDMLGFVAARTQPEERLLELAGRLAGRSSAGAFGRALEDYTWLLDRMVGDTVEFSYASLDRHASVRERDEMTDWILTFQSDGPGAVDHALARWRATRRETWLVAAAARMPASHPQLEEVLQAAAASPPASSAFPTLVFHRARLLVQSSRLDQARVALDAVLAAPTALPASAVNLLRAARLLTARTLDDFLVDAVRTRVVAPYGRMPIGRLAFDADAADVLNERMPLARLQQAAEASHLPDTLRRDVALTAVARAVLLRDHRRAIRLAGTARRLAPGLGRALSPLAEASSPDQAHAAGLLLLLRHPGLKPYVPAVAERDAAPDKIDSLRDNWWCGFSSAEAAPDRDNRVAPYETGYAYRDTWRVDRTLRSLHPQPRVILTPPFLPDADLVVAGRELDALAARGTAPNDLAREAVRFAQASPDDPRAPEALHLAVRATRFGCTDAETGTWSRAAFDLLHRRYARTEWARRTPYWFR
jgi:hypothetical protein